MSISRTATSTLHATLYRPDGAGSVSGRGGVARLRRPDPSPGHRGAALCAWANVLSLTVLSCCFRILSDRAAWVRNAASTIARYGHRASASPTPMPHGAGCSSRAMCAAITFRYSAGRTAAPPRLWTVRPTAAPHDDGTDFRSAVALYPSCSRLRETAWSARVPTLILIGSADDWTPAAACQQMVAGARDRSARVQIVVYPGAHHEFDWRQFSGPSAHRPRQYGRSFRQGPWRHQSRGSQRCAQARAAMAGALMAAHFNFVLQRSFNKTCRRISASRRGVEQSEAAPQRYLDSAPQCLLTRPDSRNVICDCETGQTMLD